MFPWGTKRSSDGWVTGRAVCTDFFGGVEVVYLEAKGIFLQPTLVRILLDLTTGFDIWITRSFLSGIFIEVDVSSDKARMVKIPELLERKVFLLRAFVMEDSSKPACAWLRFHFFFLILKTHTHTVRGMHNIKVDNNITGRSPEFNVRLLHYMFCCNRV